MTAPAHAHAANRALVLVARPGRPAVTGRLLFLPRCGGRAKVYLPSGAVISVPVESLTIIDGDTTP